jgi:hypothetical protein
MREKTTRPVSPPTAPVEEEPRVVESIGFEQTPKGWVVLVIKTRGDRVVSKDLAGEPAGKSTASEFLKMTVAKRLILGLKDA